MKIIYVLLILFCFSCTPSCDYPYRETLDKFLAKEVNYTIPQEETILIFLPLDGCNPCLQGTVKMLMESKANNLDIVVSTKDNDTIKKFGLDKLDLPKNRIHHDTMNNYERYEMGIVAPMIFHFKDGKCVFHSETTDDKKSIIKKHFGWS
ncbi:hypothetical protein SanaruYs_10910 [Chryseotalea sanaruensis]|uniref:Alkyl hydroperoxide reductase subunit C/ Thiol specific antioxidant domain-containing protein n=1 Tax=Chryseotalea sanaruensis TaxID=2482724 RepID=A0A401U7K7_9BACT|nr:hypothetical protein [Chryseotalea sanaruensis]GCC50872.1 hypothetical protein SanaruYs_10910 [Chryseotalea sanaruensis]